MGRKCAYPECRSTEGLHSLPANRETAHRWLHALGRLDIPTASVYVCNLHFTRECFSNYAEVEMGFKKQLLLDPDAVPTPAKVVTQGTGGSVSRVFPAIRYVASQTDPPERKSVSTQYISADCFFSQAQNNAGFPGRLMLNDTAVPTLSTTTNSQPGTGGSVSRFLPPIRHVASQTEGLGKKSVGTQLSMKTLQNHIRSKATQAKVTSKDCGVGTLTFPLDSPILFLQPTIVKRPSKRPRLSLTDEEEGPSKCS